VVRRREEIIELISAEAHRVGDSREILPRRGRATRPLSQLTIVALGTPDKRLTRPGE
jgi:hypothetical protein